MAIFKSKKDALLACLSVWEFLRDNPTASKEYAVEASGLPKMNNNCPACQYDFERTKAQCSECPVSAWRNTGADIGRNRLACIERQDSPYILWCDSETSEDRQSGAEAMVALIKKELYLLGMEEK